MIRIGFLYVLMGGVSLLFVNCRKLVAIPPPINTLTTPQVFATDAQATSAMTGVYYTMINNSGLFQDDATIYGGASADEFIFFSQNTVSDVEFQNNLLLSNNGTVATLWQSAYTVIYGCNAVLGGVKAATGIHDSVKNELIGEAEFVRAFSYFYLVNLFGNVPLVTTINYNATSLLASSPPSAIYASIISDLKDAQNRLPADYSVGGGQRIVPDKWAANALLARVYLYIGDWTNAASSASSLIANTSLFGLEPNLLNVYSDTSREAIWQLQQSNLVTPYYNGTPEGVAILPPSQTAVPPLLYLSSTLMAAFEDSDLRKVNWTDSTVYLGTVYYYPTKYNLGSQQVAINGSYSQYYMVLRLGEQYLIRAEAEANGANGGVDSAISDLNVVRGRAGLQGYTGSTDNNSVLAAIYHERQVELFAEWGHRWFDLKRWPNASQILSTNKGISVSNDALLFPIPGSELTADHNLTQNNGYH